MSRITVDEIQSQVAGMVDLDEDTSVLSSDDYSLRLSYINRAQREWAEISDWQVLYDEYNVLVSTSTGNASIALPNNFRKLASVPLIPYNSTDTDKYLEVLPQQDNQYNDYDNRVWVLGSPNEGYTLRVFGSTLASGASVKVPFYRSPASLASPANIPTVPNAEYLVQRVVSYVWESREDARFPQAKAEADKILQNMLEYENVYNRASDYDRIKTVEQTRYNFRLGRD